MNKNDVKVIQNSPIELSNKKITLNNIPKIIEEEFTTLEELGKSVNSAEKAAIESKKAANNAINKSAGFGKKRAAIEELQYALGKQSHALQLSIESQKVSFEFQEKLALSTKFLFGLGIMSIANNRSVVRQIEMKLKGASQEEISDLARQELVNVVKQLKAQEDISIKIDNINNIQRLHDNSIKQLNKNSDEIKKNLISYKKDVNNLDGKLVTYERKINEYKQLLDNHQQKIILFSKEIESINFHLQMGINKINASEANLVEFENRINCKLKKNLTILFIIGIVLLVLILLYFFF